jgi:peptidoglycan-associated lipoprotein
MRLFGPVIVPPRISTSRAFSTSILVLIVMAAAPALVGCTPQPKTTPATAQSEPPPPPAPPPTVPEPPPPAEEPSGSATTPGFPQNLEEFSDEPALKDVLFEPDRADIVRDGASIMMSNARWLVARWLVDNRAYFVLIEGHTDAREARGNNQLIAELRAKAAARFLVAMGVPEARLNTVSYGSARPACTERSDACAARNRRVHFRVKRQ